MSCRVMRFVKAPLITAAATTGVRADFIMPSKSTRSFSSVIDLIFYSLYNFIIPLRVSMISNHMQDLREQRATIQYVAYHAFTSAKNKAHLDTMGEKENEADKKSHPAELLLQHRVASFGEKLLEASKSHVEREVLVEHGRVLKGLPEGCSKEQRLQAFADRAVWANAYRRLHGSEWKFCVLINHSENTAA